MSRIKRFQIPVDSSEDRLIQDAARKQGRAAAEWARELLKKEALRIISPNQLTPKQAVHSIFTLNGPVEDVEKMINSSFDSRYDSRPDSRPDSKYDPSFD